MNCRDIRNGHRNRSLFVALVIFFPLIISLQESNKNRLAMIVIFILGQMFIVSIGLLMILLRLIRLMKSGNTWIYYFCGFLNICFGFIDLILFFVKHTLTTTSLCVLLLVNLFIGTFIMRDIYREPI